MKANKIRTVLQYRKSSLPILQQGYSNGEYLEFTNLDTYVRIFGNFPEACYDIEGSEIYNNQACDPETILNWPKPVELGKLIVSIDIKGMQEKLMHLSNFTGNDFLRPQLSGFGVDGKNFAATDAHVLSYFEHGAKMPKDFQKTIGHAITKMIDTDATSIDFYENHTVLHTKVNGIKAEVIQRNPDGKYPNYLAVLPEASCYTHKIEVPQRLLKDMVDANKKYGNKNKNEVKVYEKHWEVSDEDLGTQYKGELTINEGSPKEVKTIIMPVMGGAKIAFNIKLLERIAGKFDLELFFNESNKAICVQYKESAKPKKSAPKKKDDDIVALMEKIEALQKENAELKAQIKESKDNLDAMPELNIEIVDYSAKAFAIFGSDTKQFKEEIKDKLFGMFNSKLKRDGQTVAGWIVSKRYEKELRTLFA